MRTIRMLIAGVAAIASVIGVGTAAEARESSANLSDGRVPILVAADTFCFNVRVTIGGEVVIYKACGWYCPDGYVTHSSEGEQGADDWVVWCIRYTPVVGDVIGP